MHTVENSGENRKTGSYREDGLRWLLAGGANFALGYLGVLPFMFISVALECDLFPGLGWGSATYPKCEEDQGLHAFLAVGSGIFMAITFVAVNYLCRLGFSVRAWVYWPLVSIALLIPFLVAWEKSAMWGPLAW